MLRRLISCRIIIINPTSLVESFAQETGPINNYPLSTVALSTERNVYT